MPVGGGTRRGGDVDFSFCSIEKRPKRQRQEKHTNRRACHCMCVDLSTDNYLQAAEVLEIAQRAHRIAGASPFVDE